MGHPDIEGLEARDHEGEKLGTVVKCGDAAFVIERGVFFPRDFIVPYTEIARVTEGEVYLWHSREAYAPTRRPSSPPASDSLGVTTGDKPLTTKDHGATPLDPFIEARMTHETLHDTARAHREALEDEDDDAVTPLPPQDPSHP